MNPLQQSDNNSVITFSYTEIKLQLNTNINKFSLIYRYCLGVKCCYTLGIYKHFPLATIREVYSHSKYQNRGRQTDTKKRCEN